jgi:hypothetical protein
MPCSWYFYLLSQVSLINYYNCLLDSITLEASGKNISVEAYGGDATCSPASYIFTQIVPKDTCVPVQDQQLSFIATWSNTSAMAIPSTLLTLAAVFVAFKNSL